MIDDYLCKGWIHESSSYSGHPVLIIHKKDGKLHMSVDYQTLNAKNMPNRHHLPHIDDLIDSLHEYTHFTKIDLQSGYHQVLVAEEDRYKMLFLLHKGLYEYNIMPLGLMNAPETLQRLMNSVFYEFLDKF